MRTHAHRTYLFVPGNNERRVGKALASAADAAILDLEDAVAVAEKVETRTKVRQALELPSETAVYVRVNAYDTPFCYGDITAVVAPGLDGVMLPKLESVSDMLSVDWLIGNLERDQGLDAGSVGLLPIIETARGVAALRDMTQAAPARVRRFAFGAADYAKDLGMEWTLDEGEMLPVRSEMVLASRLGGLEPPIDTVFVHIREADAFRRSCETVRGLGFQGKMLIHPDQIAPANAVFTPTTEQIAWAEKIVAAFEDAETAGVASIQVDGYFVDYPIVDKARRTIEMSRLLRDLGKLS